MTREAKRVVSAIVSAIAQANIANPADIRTAATAIRAMEHDSEAETTVYHAFVSLLETNAARKEAILKAAFGPKDDEGGKAYFDRYIAGDR